MANMVKLFTVTIQYKSGVVSHLVNVVRTENETDYGMYMLIQLSNKDSLYVNMEQVEELRIGEQTNG